MMARRLAGLCSFWGACARAKACGAERAVAQSSGAGGLFYLATAEPRADDLALQERIAQHKARRGSAWQVVEESFDIARAIEAQVPSDASLLVECLTLWLATLLEKGADLEVETERLLSVLARRNGQTFLVSNEVGMGVIPDNALARTFVDAAGRLHTQLAERGRSVSFGWSQVCHKN